MSMLKIKEKNNFLKLKSRIPKHCRSSENTKQKNTKKAYTWTYHFPNIGNKKIKSLKNPDKNKNPPLEEKKIRIMTYYHKPCKYETGVKYLVLKEKTTNQEIYIQ